MSKPRILVARAIFPDIVDRLRAHFDVEDNPGDVIWTPTSDRHPDAALRVVARSRDDLIDFWAPVGDSAEAELAGRKPRDAVRPETVRWLALGPIRLVETMESGHIVSKTAAARAAAERWPEHADLLDRAVRDRAGERQDFTAADARQAIALLRECVNLAHDTPDATET